MKVKAILIALMISASLLSFGQEMPWAKDWKSAVSTAKSSKKLIMVDFYTEW